MKLKDDEFQGAFDEIYLAAIEGEAAPSCGKCGTSEEVVRGHHVGDGVAPECDYWVCQECGTQWGHE